MPKHSVFFKSDNIQVEVDAGTDLLTASRLAKLEMQCTCGGEGTCGKCLLKVVSGSVQTTTVMHGELSVACQTRVVGDVVVEIPPESRLTGNQVVIGTVSELPSLFRFDPLCKKVCLQLTPPSLTDPSSDASRLLMALRKFTDRDVELDLSQIRFLADILRSSNWNVDVTYVEIAGKAHVISIDSHNHQACLFGIAVDVGTTTVVVYLVDLLSGSVIGQEGTHNRQAQFGGDVITRIIYASDESCGLEKLQKAVIETINYLIGNLVDKYIIDIADIRVIVTAGNTTMAHLLLGIQPCYIRLEPYVPAANCFPVAKAKELGLNVHPNAVVFSFPAVASYVGGDIVAGVLINGMAKEEKLTLFMDIGTNGEMVLGNQDWLVSCACSAGTAFEGAGITCGMRAMQGAIERLTIDPHTFTVNYSTIGEIQPLGICGSGLINVLAEMRKVGIIDRAGKIQDVLTARIRRLDAGKQFVLAWADETAGGERDIVITEADIKSLLRTKGAIYAGMRSLLKSVDLDMSSIERVYIAGGFGSYLNIEDAVEIGLLPDLGSAKYCFLGNTSINGALTALISSAALEVAQQLAESITYVELSAGNLFMEEFISALFLPHTDLNLFPSVGS
ncbi:uncharacterized 2Fe-2S/4Fe-4S cluster protein (DUF4445 family) [Sporomusaceae bacterium BoRhaA]|uniref:ASKHA domain-containing protein n=1 Tax=Pelorhabdus rhamnosifermentans TaxID=2772457 RepID=UPI001C0623CD|nr:ASKHA domain-containing protein [Pelorhabdus rhamnosifermentans]MBU2703114.1 uncharacterized 2Fe-2S/4Fe-4S cluster protein (DUF4445 family) [Pelorhabdus rhamnosifermentans]